jgi:serine O-acetyltransferase
MDEGFFAASRQDLIAHVPEAQRNMSRLRWLIAGVKVSLRSSGFHVIVSYRIAHLCLVRFGYFGRVVAAFISGFVRHWYGCSLASTARIEGGAILPHPLGIVIGAHVSIGPRTWIFQNVTVGGVPEKSGHPRIGSDARIYAGAVIVGPITVGDGVTIGANAVVSQDVPSHACVRAGEAQLTISQAR